MGLEQSREARLPLSSAKLCSSEASIQPGKALLQCHVNQPWYTVYISTHFGYCSTVQGLLDWCEVDLGFTELLPSSCLFNVHLDTVFAVCSTLQHTATHSKKNARHCRMLQKKCKTLQYTAIHRKKIQDCNTQQKKWKTLKTFKTLQTLQTRHTLETC